MAKTMADEEPIGEAKNSPEKQAAKGMEVRKKVEGRLEQWKERFFRKNKVAKEYMKAWDKVRASAKEGSFRHQVYEKLTPVIEAAAIGRGLQLEATKRGLKAISLVCKVAGLAGMLGVVSLPVGVPVEAIGIATGIGAHTVEFQDKAGAKISGKMAEIATKTGIAGKVDRVVDRILGWKPKEKPLAVSREALKPNQAFVAEAKPVVAKIEVKPVIPKRV